MANQSIYNAFERAREHTIAETAEMIEAASTIKYENDTLQAKVDGAWTEVELGGGGVGAAGTGTNAEIFNSYILSGKNIASGDRSHAEGIFAEASGDYSHAEGYDATASGNASHAEGDQTTASGDCSHAEGYATTASGYYSHAEGTWTIASGNRSHAAGTWTIAGDYQTAIGRYNTDTAGPTSATDTTGSLFVMGIGTGTSARSNGFRVTTAGKPYALSNLASSGADYAEYFEWQDQNPNDEDRRGRFVTLDGENIRFATAEDDYILGVISAEPTIVGDIQSEIWHDMYLKDIYGEKLTEVIEVPETTDERGRVIPAHTDTRWILNPKYDPEMEYISREYRPEWDAVGIVGKLVVVDDGTCQVNGYCYPSIDGIATASEVKTAYRVIERLDDFHIRVFIK